MAGVKSIRALARGLEVMKALEERGAASLHDLAGATGLAKPTLLRILLTLESHGYVRRGIGDRLYRRTVSADDPEERWKAELAEVSAPILDELCNDVLWPSDLGVYEHGVIHIQETTRRLSPFLLNRDVHRVDIHVLPSAMGRAVLAWSSPERLDAICQELVERGRRPDALAAHPEKLERLLGQIRERGYAARAPGYYVTHRREARVSAIALPILMNGEAVGAVNLAWVAGAFSEREFARRYLRQLRAAANAINEALTSRIMRGHPSQPTWLT